MAKNSNRKWCTIALNLVPWDNHPRCLTHRPGERIGFQLAVVLAPIQNMILLSIRQNFEPSSMIKDKFVTEN